VGFMAGAVWVLVAEVEVVGFVGEGEVVERDVDELVKG
jgi:hypothetical protein